MANAIRFLESIGHSSLSEAQIAARIALLDIDEEQRKALIERDQDALSRLLGGRERLFSSIFAPDEEQSPQPLREEEPDEEDPEEAE